MRTPKLRRIDLKKRYSKEGSCNKRNPGSEHPNIRKGCTYLVNCGGSLYTGAFSRVWFGWSFDGWHAPLQLGTTTITDLWQVIK